MVLATAISLMLGWFNPGPENVGVAKVIQIAYELKQYAAEHDGQINVGKVCDIAKPIIDL